jgi:hypothetical protein
MSSELREALNKIGNISAFVAENCGNADTAKYMNDIISIVQEIVAEPLKNCEVGTVEEQKQRFDAFCSRGNCDNCPFEEEGVWSNCAIRWSQMPYESEVK